MPEPPWVSVVPLGSEHQAAVQAFACGHPTVDQWFHTQAYPQTARVRTFVCARPRGEICALFALKTAVLATGELSSNMRHGANETEPAVLLCQLGIDSAYQRQRLFRPLMLEVFRQCVAVDDRAPVRYLVVDALEADLVPLYQRHQFTRVGATTRLVVKTSAVRALLRAQERRGLDAR